MMESSLYFVVILSVIVLLLSTGVWVAFSLLGVGFLVMMLLTSSDVGSIMTTSIWASMNSWSLAAIPLFIWMGEILARSHISRDLFNGIAPWIRRLPGGLIHINVLGCGLFAAVSGSSVATAATMGKITIPELLKRGYPESLTLGSLAGSGTFGFLIPPSIILLVYGVAVDESIIRLFVAGIIPGVLLIVMFSGFIIVRSMLVPEEKPVADISLNFKQKLTATARLVPILILIAGVLGSIYIGIASPTDAGAVGVALALLLCWVSGTLTRQSMIDGLLGAVRTSSMIIFILIGASFVTVSMGFTGIPRELAEWMARMDMSPQMLIFKLTILFIILGCFLDGISMVVLTTAVIYPIVQNAGIDPIWFGIYLAIVVEMSQITPPIGFNLFALQGLTGKNILYLARCSMPFFFLMLASIVIIWIFPEIVLWLPDHILN